MKPFKRTDHGERANYEVHGFWSGSPIRVIRFLEGGTSINWDSGGRDTTEEPDNITAAENFAKALLDAVEVARAMEEGNG